MPTKAVQHFMLGTVVGNETQARETLAAMAQQDRCHAQSVRNLLACLLS